MARKDAILVVNAGSSSLKFQVFEVKDYRLTSVVLHFLKTEYGLITRDIRHTRLCSEAQEFRYMVMLTATRQLANLRSLQDAPIAEMSCN